jgi:DNA-binding NarL/FixJ family response regulator
LYLPWGRNAGARRHITLIGHGNARETGVQVARQLQVAGSPVRILALSAYDDEQYIVGLLASGAAAYLTKDQAIEMIVDAVRAVAKRAG